ncbi:MAG TPA: ABC transporter substrate-binding protein [Chloroflexota bacterium]|nr:ABC transporter substrate-binding protein [Chloroflexota bacterium]
MRQSAQNAWISLGLALLLAGCAAGAPRGQTAATDLPQASARKQIVAGILSQPAGFFHEMTNPTGTPSSVPGLQETYQLVNATLSYTDLASNRHAWLAEDVPSTDNGLWTVHPDGRMDTTWRIRKGVRWHDGEPMTSDDLRFTMDVYRDKDSGVLTIPELALVESVDTPDAQTIVVHWRRPLISADSMFGGGIAMWPLPQHVLDQPFRDNKDGFLGLSYWRGDFVGTGPFKVEEWVTDSHIVLVANDDYVLGRPRIDQVVVRFFSERSAFVAAILASAIQLPLGRGLYPEDVMQVREAGHDIKTQLSGPLGNLAPVYPQFMNPDPPIVANVNFRRALLMAIDRQEMTETLNYGLSPVAQSWVQPDIPEGRAVEDSIVRYDYNLRAASQMIQDLGYTKDPDGMFRDSSGALLSVSLKTHTQNSAHQPGTLAVARYWKAAGIDVQLEILGAEAAHDLKWRAEYPAFFFIIRGLRIDHPDQNFATKVIPTSDNHYVGGNVARFGSAEADGYIDRYLRTIPFGERTAALADLVHLQTDQVTMMPLFFQGAAYVVGANNIQNVNAGTAGTGQAWNAYQWDMS